MPTAAPDPMRPRRARVAAVRAETPGVATLELAPLDPLGEPPAPGQFNMLYAFGIGEAAISVSGPGDGPLTHTIRDVGAVFRALAGMQPGDVVGVRGPFGAGWPLAAQAGRRLVVVAGGLGLAPLRGAILAALADPGRFPAPALVYGARAPSGVLYAGEFAAWEARGLRVLTTVDRPAPGWTGAVGVVTARLGEALAGTHPARVSAFVCGPEVMMRFAARALTDLGVAADRVWLSMERNMKCALRVCGRCQWGPDFVCRDGPVVRWDRVAARIADSEI